MKSKPLTLTMLGAGVAAALALSGCGAGPDAQTERMVAAVPGVSANLEHTDKGIDLALRNMVVEYNADGYTKGATAPLVVHIANAGRIDDKLTKVSTPAASGIELVTPDGGSSSSAPASGSGSGSGTPSGSASGSGTGSPSGSGSPSDTGASGFAVDVTVDSGDHVTLASKQAQGDGEYLELQGLKHDIAPGDLIKVTFTFAKAGSVTVKLPMTPPAQGPSDSANAG